MRDLGGVAGPIIVGLIVLIILALFVALAYMLARRTRSEADRSGPAVEPALVADGVLALHSLNNEVRALRNALIDLGTAIQTRPVSGGQPSPTFSPAHPLLAIVRGIANLEHLVQVEHAFEGLDHVQNVGIQTYRQGRGDFVMALRQPLTVEFLRSSIAAAVGVRVTVDAADPDQGRVELRLATQENP